MKAVKVGMLVAVTATLACAPGSPQPKIKTMTWHESVEGEADQVQTLHVEYSEDRIARFLFGTEGSIEFEYVDSRIAGLVLRSDAPGRANLFYGADGTLSEREYAWDDGSTTSISYRYTGDRIAASTRTRRYADGSVRSSTRRYAYDRADRLTSIQHSFDDALASHSFRYGGEELSSYEFSAPYDQFEATYLYDSSGRVVRLNAEATASTIEYEGDLIHRIREVGVGSSAEITIEYEEGDVVGATPVPPFLGGALFGMDGRPSERFAPLNFESLLDDDV